MQGLVIVEPGRTELREVEEPRLGADEVLLRVDAVGFCGGDLNAYRGTFPLQQYPTVLGHEIGAVIEERGRDVPRELRVGGAVTASPYKSCGTCLPCRSGRPNACVDNRTMGVRRPGAMTKYIAVPWRDVYPSDTLSAVELALVEPLTVGFHAAERGGVANRDTVAVIGCGIVGLGAIASAVTRGAEVVAVDVDARKLKIASALGAAHTIDASAESVHDRLAAITAGDGPTVVIEAVGSAQTYRSAVEEVAFTGRVVYIGYGKAPVEYESRLFVQKELTILGSRNSLGDFPRVIEFLERRTFPLELVVSRTVPLEAAGEALAEWAVNPSGVVKIMVRL